MLRIALQSIRDYYRDGSALFFGLIFPIVMVAFLGNMLAGLDNPDGSVGTIKIAYHTEQGAEQAIGAFVGALEETDSIELLPAKSEADAEKSVDGETADVAFIFSAEAASDGSGNITGTPSEASSDGTGNIIGNTVSVKVYEGGDSIKNRAALMIAKSFARESAAVSAAFATLGAENPQKIAEFADKLPSLMDGQSGRNGLVTDAKREGRAQSMMDFYAVTMVIMICFMGSGIGAASGMYLLRRERLLDRLSVSPKRGEAIFLESVLGGIPGSLAQVVAVMIPSTLLLGAHYAATPADNILLFAFFALLGTTVFAAFMLLGLVSKVNPYMPVMCVLWTMLFISGSFNKGIVIPGLTEYLPMNIMNRAAFELTLFGRPGQVLTIMAVLAVILTASCAAGSLLIRRSPRRKDIAL
ncbi:MAG: ABC transporter permease [Clostridiales Family XIII bacterium]|jgi:ABC-2 type transport system permease protein|nr:ABC transporter permease [Clostridiales Family XIII bacterium]